MTNDNFHYDKEDWTDLAVMFICIAGMCWLGTDPFEFPLLAIGPGLVFGGVFYNAVHGLRMNAASRGYKKGVDAMVSTLEDRIEEENARVQGR